MITWDYDFEHLSEREQVELLIDFLNRFYIPYQSVEETLSEGYGITFDFSFQDFHLLSMGADIQIDNAPWGNYPMVRKGIYYFFASHNVKFGPEILAEYGMRLKDK